MLPLIGGVCKGSGSNRLASSTLQPYLEGRFALTCGHRLLFVPLELLNVAILNADLADPRFR